jgi:hypothetical protein
MRRHCDRLAAILLAHSIVLAPNFGIADPIEDFYRSKSKGTASHLARFQSV